MTENIKQKSPWAGLMPFLVNLVLLMIILMVSGPALPYISVDYGLTAAQIPWQNTLYTMSGAILAPLMGWIGDNKGLKKQMIIGTLVFIAGNLLCAVAPSYALFCAGRFLTGFGAAAITPATMNYINMEFPDDKKVSAFAIMGACASLGSAVGPYIAGILLVFISWKTMFIVCSVFMAIGLALAIFGIKNTAGSGTQKLDIIGMLTLLIGLAALLSLLTLSSTLGWTNPVILALIAVTIVALVLFYKHEAKSEVVLVDVSLLKKRSFMAPSLLQFMQCAITGYLTTAISYYFAAGLGLSSSLSGTWMTVYFIVAFPVSFLVGKLSSKLSAKVLCMGAVVTWALAILSCVVSNPSTPIWILFAGAALASIGNAFVPALCNAVALSEISPNQAGAASGTIQMFMSLGSPVSIAIVVPYLSIIGSQNGIPNYAASFPAVSKLMFAVVAISVVLVLLFPKDKK